MLIILTKINSQPVAHKLKHCRIIDLALLLFPPLLREPRKVSWPTQQPQPASDDSVPQQAPPLIGRD